MTSNCYINFHILLLTEFLVYLMTFPQLQRLYHAEQEADHEW